MKRKMNRTSLFEIASNARATEREQDGRVRSRYFEEDLLTDLVAYQLRHDEELARRWVDFTTGGLRLDGKYQVQTQVTAPAGLGSMDMVLSSQDLYIIYEHKINAGITKNNEGKDQLSRYLKVTEQMPSERDSRVVLVARGLKKVEAKVAEHPAFMQVESQRHHLWDDFVQCLDGVVRDTTEGAPSLLASMRQDLLHFFNRYPGMRREKKVTTGGVTFDGILFDDWTYEEAHYQSVKTLFARTDERLSNEFPHLHARGNKLGVTREVTAGDTSAEAKQVSHYRFCRSGFSTIPAEALQALSSPIFEIQMNIADEQVRNATAETLAAKLRGEEDCMVGLGKGASEKQVRLFLSLAEEVRELNTDLSAEAKLVQLGEALAERFIVGYRAAVAALRAHSA